MIDLPPGRRRHAAGVVVLAAMLAVAAACRPPAPALSHTSHSPDALARALLDRLAARDQAGLEQLRLTRDEFETHVWPHLPASRPETNMSVAFVWNRLDQQSDGRLAQLLAAHGGMPYTFVALEFRGARTTYGDVEVVRDSVMTVRTAAGDIEQLELFGSMIAQGGRYKVFSYVTD